VNPVPLVQGSCGEGALVELVTGRTLSVPLYWQHTPTADAHVGRLTRAVVSTAGVRFAK